MSDQNTGSVSPVKTKLPTSKIFCLVLILLTTLSIFNGVLILFAFSVGSIAYSSKLAKLVEAGEPYELMRRHLRANGLNAMVFTVTVIVSALVMMVLSASQHYQSIVPYMSILIGLIICSFVVVQIINIFGLLRSKPPRINAHIIFTWPISAIRAVVRAFWNGLRNK